MELVSMSPLQKAPRRKQMTQHQCRKTQRGDKTAKVLSKGTGSHAKTGSAILRLTEDF
jgi:hypothetical protein